MSERDLAADVVASLTAACYEMINALPEFERALCATAADVGERPVFFPPEPGDSDESWHVEFAGQRLGRVLLSVAPDTLGGDGVA